MKKLISFLSLILVLNVLSGCGRGNATYTLKVFNWGEYADLGVIAEFEKQFDCKVIYETFDSNEAMYTKLLGGNKYDVMIPSDYMIERLIQEELVQKIDWNLITNSDSIDTAVLNQEFDKSNDYWVPYFYGNVGILYDKTKVNESDLTAGWEVLRNETYKGDLYMYDSERDSFMVALKALGYSMNTTDKKEIEAAYEWLLNQRDTMNPTYATDDIIDNMMNSEKALAVVYSGDAATIMSENEDMGFYLPEEGTNYWFDGFVVSKDCEEVDIAMEFINFMIEDENALRNTLEVGYLTTNKNAATEAKENEFIGNSAYDIRMGQNDELFAYQDEKTKSLFSDYWTKIKAK